MQVLRTLVLVALLPAALSAPQPGADNVRVVSLEDVTGTTARSPVAEAAAAALLGATQVGYDAHRPAQGGVVSLEDVTGSVEHTVSAVIGHPLPSLPHPRPPSRPGQQVGVVSLEDVTGHADDTVPIIGHPLPNLVPPQRRPGRPGPQGGGVVSLEDVTGHADDTVPAGPSPLGPWPRPLYPYRLPPPPAPRPAESSYYNLVDPNGHHSYQTFRLDGPQRPHYRTAAAGGQASAVCVEQDPVAVAVPAEYALRPLNFPEQKTEYSDGKPSLGRHRARRSPKPIGVVSLENVAGPVAAHYPAYGPPAYVRPNYYPYPNYYGGGGGGWYQRPRPYVYAVPCIGGVPILTDGSRRLLLPVTDATRRPGGGASERLEQREEYYTEDVPPEFIRRRRR